MHILILLFAFVGSSFADKSLTELEQANEFKKFERRLHLSFGKIALNESADILLEDSYRYLGVDDSMSLLWWLGQPAPWGLHGTILKNTDVVTVSEFNKGHISDVTIDPAAVLVTLKEFLEKTTHGRTQIIDWVQKPTLENQVLTWAIQYKVTDEDEKIVQYNKAVLHRRGAYLLRHHQQGSSSLDLNAISKMIAPKEGFRYQDFDPTVDTIYNKGAGGLISGKSRIETYENTVQPVVVVLNVLNNLLFVLVIVSWFAFMKRAREKVAAAKSAESSEAKKEDDKPDDQDKAA